MHLYYDNSSHISAETIGFWKYYLYYDICTGFPNEREEPPQFSGYSGKGKVPQFSGLPRKM
jgi:hypothetical protein